MSYGDNEEEATYSIEAGLVQRAYEAARIRLPARAEVMLVVFDTDDTGISVKSSFPDEMAEEVIRNILECFILGRVRHADG